MKLKEKTGQFLRKIKLSSPTLATEQKRASLSKFGDVKPDSDIDSYVETKVQRTFPVINSGDFRKLVDNKVKDLNAPGAKEKFTIERLNLRRPSSEEEITSLEEINPQLSRCYAVATMSYGNPKIVNENISIVAAKTALHHAEAALTVEYSDGMTRELWATAAVVHDLVLSGKEKITTND